MAPLGHGFLPALELADVIETYADGRVIGERHQRRGTGPAFRPLPWYARAAELREMAALGHFSPDRLAAGPMVSCTEYGLRVGVAPRTVRRWAKAGQLEGSYQLEDETWLIPADAERPDRKGRKRA